MNHRVYGKKLSRSTNERKRLREMLVRDFLLHGFVVTTKAKIQSIRPLIETLITKAKKGRSSDFYEIRRVVRDRAVFKILVQKIAPAIKERPGGYTRMIKMGLRKGDSSQVVRFELLDDIRKNIAVIDSEKITNKKSDSRIKSAKVSGKSGISQQSAKKETKTVKKVKSKVKTVSTKKAK